MNFTEMSSRLSAWNREPMHAPFYCYPDIEQAKSCVKGASSNCRSLNGIWQIAVYPTVEDTPDSWMEKPLATKDMPVPANWEFHEVGLPIYTNVIYPFDRATGDHSFEVQVVEGEYILNAPYVPKDNLNVCYYTDFALTKEELGKKVILQFGSVETAFELAVNGTVIGFSQDSKLEAEFDITSYIKEGENALAVRVYQYSAHSYLEDQDYWHTHGIQRDVTLRFQGKTHISDFKAWAEFGETMKDAELVVKIWADRSVDFFGEDTVTLHLFAPDGTKVATEELKPFTAYRGYLIEDFVPEVRMQITSPMLWDNEHPDLYTLVIEQKNKDGETLDLESCKIGFREIRIVDGVLQINRKRMVVRGTNLHEWSAATGRYVSEEEIRATLLKIKELNFNAVRTCHYPKAVNFYDLCDELGLYVVDETNLETHGYGGNLSADQQWLYAYMDRVTRMCLRDKNHPSIVIWSLGNESGAGVNHAAMYGWLKEYDSRPVQYESGGSKRTTSDILCPMYPTNEWILESMGNDDIRPFIMCEYAYAKSNSNGNLEEYWDKIRMFPRFQGGFVWDFHDKAMPQTMKDGKTYYRYAGAFGESVMDPVKDMCLNGVVYPDLSEKSQAKEVKFIQAPVQITYTSWHGMGGKYVISNEYHRDTLEHHTCTWNLVCDGVAVESGTIALTTKPLCQEEFVVAYNRNLVRGEAFINIYITAPDGNLIYQKQIEAEGSVRWSRSANTYAENDPKLEVTETDADLKISAGDNTLIFNKLTGTFANEEDNLFRAPTGIDEGQWDNSYHKEWVELGLYDAKANVKFVRTIVTKENVLLFTEVQYLEGKITISKRYEITEKEVTLTATFRNRSGVTTLPRIGIGLKLPKEFNQVKWYGRGPWENYADRKLSAFVGLYDATVEDMHEDYIRCCECGGREDVRYLTVTNADGKGIRITGETLFHFSILPWTPAEYMAADYVDQLPESTCNYLAIDAVHAGLGGDTGWTRNIHPQYQIPDGDYVYTIHCELILY